MSEPSYSSECVPPGGQRVLFRVPRTLRLAPVYRVMDRDGVERLRTNALGVAVSAARQVVAEHTEAWLHASDGTTAYVGPDGVSSDTPDRPWIATVAEALETRP